VSDKRVLVAYFSSSGNTKKVAEAIAAALSADLEAIIESNPRPVSIRGKGLGNFLGIARSGFHAMSSRAVPIKDAQLQPSDYGLVVLGSPVHAGSLSGQVRSYIDRYAAQFKAVAFFVTGEAPSQSKILVQMEKSTDKVPVAVAIFKADDIRAGRIEVLQFVAELRGHARSD
jgi:menaquinone-dependent protoporphyrinogen IX oxidase